MSCEELLCCYRSDGDRGECCQMWYFQVNVTNQQPPRFRLPHSSRYSSEIHIDEIAAGNLSHTTVSLYSILRASLLSQLFSGNVGLCLLTSPALRFQVGQRERQAALISCFSLPRRTCALWSLWLQCLTSTCALLKLLFFPCLVSLTWFSVQHFPKYYQTSDWQLLIESIWKLHIFYSQFLNRFDFPRPHTSSVAAKCSMISKHNLFSLCLTNFWWGWCKLAKILLQSHPKMLGCWLLGWGKTFKCIRSTNIVSSRDGCLSSALMSECKHCQ